MKKINTIKRYALLLLAVAWGASLRAQLTVAPADQQVNTTTTDNQLHPSTAQAGNGNALIVWESADQDGDGYGIYGQFRDAIGAASGTEFLINTTTSGDQRMADVAMDDAGNAIVVWMDASTDGDAWGIFAQRYTATGTTSGSEFQVNVTTAGVQRQPAVAMNDNGAFVIAWEGDGTDGDGMGIVARTYDNTGTATNSEILVNDSTAGYQGYPDVSIDASGNFALTWQSQSYDGSGNGVFAKSFSASGSVLATEFAVNTTTSGNQQEPAIAMDGSGNMAIAWSAFDGVNNVFQVNARRFDLNGNALSGEVVVNGSTTEAHDHAHLAMTVEGTYTISYSAYGRDGAYHGIYAQAFDASGTASGSDVIVNTETTQFQQFSSTAWRRDSLAMVLTWQSGFRNDLTTQDGDGYGVYTKLAGNFDQEAPVAVCQDVVLFLDGNGAAALTSTAVDGGSSDNVGITSFSLDITAFDCNDLGANVVTFTIADLAGNQASCTANVTVLDTTAPDAMCKNLTIDLASDGTVALTAAEVNNNSSDNCSFTYGIDLTSFDCNGVATHVVTLTAVDGSGNTSICTSDVTVRDNEAPTALCSDVTLVLSGNSATLTAAQVENGSSDNCGVATTSIDQTSFDCNDTGSNTVSLTVTDINGNSANCAANVTVQDNTPPVAMCSNQTLDLDGSGAVTADPFSVDNGSSDACGLFGLTLSKTAFDCSDIGSNQVTLTATDRNGNTDNCTATITIRDKAAPTITCPANETYSCVANIPAGDVNPATAVDNCDTNPGVTFQDVVLGVSCMVDQYNLTRIYTAVDDNSNTSLCTQQFTVNVPTSVSSGSCSWCFAKVTIKPSCYNPASIYVSSCEKITKLKIKDADNVWQEYNNLSTKSGTWTHPSGKAIKQIKVKSGCTGNNYSHNFNLCDGSSKADEEMNIDMSLGHLTLKAFPNPTDGNINVELANDNGLDTEVKVSIVNMQGQVLQVKTIRLTQGFDRSAFDLGQYSSGLYYIIVDDGDIRLTEKVVKQ